eukprot:m.22561 g.22561  ORF g.22561 m.22561 type:complete len:475 (+) comp13856_c0_seq1:115-1539(+)
MSEIQKNQAINEFYEGLGLINWWGFTPALDLLGSDTKSENVADGTDKGEVNILLVGQGDARHILKTIANARTRQDGRRIIFWVVENAIELLARQILFLALALEPTERLGLQEKVEIYLELMGNSSVRPKTSEYLAAKSKTLLDLITDPDRMKSEFPLIDTSGLKFKEKDDLTDVFDFWRTKKPVNYDMEQLWDFRLRGYFKQRYDSRANLSDWDYSMKMKDMASVIHVKQFIQWRASGIAFDLRDASYDVANRTLASNRVFREAKGPVEKRGYWGDVVNSPYITFGTESDNADLFEKRNNNHTKSASDVAMHNLTSLFHEMLTGTKYQVTNETDETTKIVDADDDGDAVGNTVGEVDVKPVSKEITQPLPGFEIKLLSLKTPSELATKSKYRNKFQVAYFASSMAHHLTPEISAAMAPNACVVAESAKFILDLKPEQKTAFAAKVTSLAEAIGAQPRELPVDGISNPHIFYSMV